MGRLFISPREINFINDIAKELVKDVIGQKIYYFSISEIKSKVHDIYEESPDKVFENPIEIDCLAKYQGQIFYYNMDSQYYYPLARIDAVSLDCRSENLASVYKNEIRSWV